MRRLILTPEEARFLHVSSVGLESLLGNPLRLRWRGWQVEVVTEAGREYRFAGPFVGG